ncbi:hypothetical protein AX15_005279 [Amanita polypyramis BW_CC]|nr:hypothetical protein AX15_005279 [Amanita polypyramis BW_CC]
MGVTHVVSTPGSSTGSVAKKHKNRRKLNKKKGTPTVNRPSANATEDREALDDGMEMEEEDEGLRSRFTSGIQNDTTSGPNASSGGVDDDDTLMIDAVPVGSSGAPVFAPLAPGAAKSSSASSGETRRVQIPPHRMSPLKKDWVNIFGPLTELLGLQVRMNLQKRSVEMRVSVAAVS